MKTQALTRNPHLSYGLMIALTLLTYSLGKAGFAGIAVVLLLLLTSVIKGWLIIANFMELLGVSLLWRVIMYGWLWLTSLAIAAAYLVSTLS